LSSPPSSKSDLRDILSVLLSTLLDAFNDDVRGSFALTFWRKLSPSDVSSVSNNDLFRDQPPNGPNKLSSPLLSSSPKSSAETVLGEALAALACSWVLRDGDDTATSEFRDGKILLFRTRDSGLEED